MGTAQVQGELWGAKADDWADIQEPTWRPIYETVFAELRLRPGTKLLDIGCGAGGALLIARELGADVAGLDAAETLVERARQRLAEARIERGEMEALPFANESFDAATSFNAFQFAGNVSAALGEARRVLKRGGQLAMVVWGRREHCDLAGKILPPVLALLPAPPPGAPAPFAYAEPGVIEGLIEQAGLSPQTSGEFDSAFSYPDGNIAWRAISSAGILVRATRLAGEDKVQSAITESLKPFTRADGSVVISNRFRWVIATRS